MGARALCTTVPSARFQDRLPTVRRPTTAQRIDQLQQRLLALRPHDEVDD